MGELSFEAGITLKIPGTDYGMAKPSIRFTIDAGGDVDGQIEQHKAALGKLAPAVEEALAQELANITGLNVEGFGVAVSVARLEKLLDFTVKEMRRQKAVIDKLAPKGRSGARKAKE